MCFRSTKGKFAVSWYDFESKEGEEFMAKKGITQHIPLVIWMDDQVKFKVDGKDIGLCRVSYRFRPRLFPGEVDPGRSAGSPRSGNREKVRNS